MKKTLLLFKRVVLILGISSMAFAGGFGDHKHHSQDVVDSAGTNVDTTKFPKKDAAETISGGWTLSGTNTFSGTNNFSGTFQLGGTAYTGTAANLNTLIGGGASDASALHIHTSGTTADNSTLFGGFATTQFLRSDANDSVTTGVTLNIDSGATLSIDGAWDIAGTAVTSTAAELNKVDGYTGTAANLNTLTDGSSTTLHSHAAGNATTLDNLDSTDFLRSSASDSVTTGVILTIDSGATLATNGTVAINAGATLTNGASNSLSVDSATTDSTATAGAIDLNVDTAHSSVVPALDINYTNVSGAGTALDNPAINITLTQNDTDSDMYGIKITAASTDNAAGGDYEAGIFIDNADTTASSMTDAIVITSSGVSGGIDNAINASATNITNALNIGSNTITDGGSGGVIDFSGFDVDASGNTSISGALDVNASIQLNTGNAGQNNGICGTDGGTGGASNVTLGDCPGTPADIAEWYETNQGIESGDIVATSDKLLTYQADKSDPDPKKKFIAPIAGELHQMSILKKSTKPYDEELMGVVSTMPYQTFGEDVKDAKGVKNPLPLALVGRVPVKVTTENGAIQVGDSITSSSTAGVGMKATKAGAIVGIALEPFNKAGVGKVMMYVMNKTFYTPEQTKKFVQKLSEEENQQALNDIMDSKEVLKLLKDGKTLTTLRTLVQLYEGSPNKQGVSALLNVPQPILNKLSLMAQKFSRYAKEKGWFTSGKNIDSLSEEELLQFFEKAFVVEEALVVKGEIVQVTKTPQFGEIVSFAATSAEPSVSDRGEARLVNGTVTIELDPRFIQLAEVSAQNSYQVQITPTSLDVQGVLIVEKRTPTGFTIVESGNGPHSNATFSWEVTALRRSFSKEALPAYQKFQKNFLNKKDNGQEEVKANTKKSNKLLSLLKK